ERYQKTRVAEEEVGGVEAVHGAADHERLHGLRHVFDDEADAADGEAPSISPEIFAHGAQRFPHVITIALVPPAPISRRALLAVAALTSACRKPRATPILGFCFVANQAGRSVSVIDLSRFRARQTDDACLITRAASTVAIASLAQGAIRSTIAAAVEPSIACFRKDGHHLITGSEQDRSLTIYDVATAKTIVRLPVAVAPRHFC